MILTMFKKSITVLTVLCILLYTPMYAYAGDTANLQGAWLLDEGSGTRSDESDNSNDLTDNNTVLSDTGQFGDAADFESGNGEYLSITDGSQTGLDLTGTYTMIMWLKPETVGPGNGTPIAKWSGGTGYMLQFDGASLILIHDSGADASYTITLSTGVWKHIAVVYDTAANDVEWIIDGSSVETDAGVTQDPSDHAGAFELGKQAGGDNYDGLIDEAVIFTRTLTTTEITDLKDNGIASFMAGVTRSRIIMIASIMAPFAEYMNIFNGINTHRKKFGVKRPNWMKLFDLFDVPKAYADPPPGVGDTANVNSVFAGKDTYQADYKAITGKYQQQVPSMINDTEHETHVYDGPEGVGYIHVARRDSNGVSYIKKKHTGPESRNINSGWVEITEEE